MTTWTVREKFIKLIDRWYLILIIFLVSAGVAWGLMHLWPLQHQATATVYIGVDINRVFDVSSIATYAESEPFNIDDYKNWQLSQIESIARSEEVAQITLEKLRNKDSYWSSIGTDEFRNMESMNWWDIGTWRLTLSAKDAEYAAQGVRVWRAVFVEYTSELIQRSEAAFDSEGRLRAIENEIVRLESRGVSLNNTIRDITSIASNIDSLSSENDVDTVTRWQLWGLAASSADFSPVWTRLLENFPEDDATPSSYLAWINEVETVLSSQLNNLEMTIDDLGEMERKLTDQYLEEIQETKGLSPNLNIEISSTDPVIQSDYPDGEVALLGGVIGVLIYLIVFIGVSEHRGERL